MEPSRCVVLVPVAQYIEPDCEAALRQLEAQGYPVRRVRGYSAIDQGRSQMAHDALADGFDELMWIDSDVGFDAQDVQRLRSHRLPMVCGLYPKKGQRSFACNFFEETETVSFGRTGGLLEVECAGFGFMHTRREVYETMRQRLELPACNQRFGRTTVPYFLPMVVPDAAGHWYLAEDYAFCERARRCGYAITADTAIRLWHIGSYRYGWEDAGRDPQRFGNYIYQIRKRP